MQLASAWLITRVAHLESLGPKYTPTPARAPFFPFPRADPSVYIVRGSARTGGNESIPGFKFAYCIFSAASKALRPVSEPAARVDIFSCSTIDMAAGFGGANFLFVPASCGGDAILSRLVLALVIVDSIPASLVLEGPELSRSPLIHAS